mmetsp:Transcript_32300/g.77209  ORF Transcript_32300/g.77209 Transcript_32300/m.77209 type:complete len:224 (-) Transcript_32300:733-1404(-)
MSMSASNSSSACCADEFDRSDMGIFVLDEAILLFVEAPEFSRLAVLLVLDLLIAVAMLLTRPSLFSSLATVAVTDDAFPGEVLLVPMPLALSFRNCCCIILSKSVPGLMLRFLSGSFAFAGDGTAEDEADGVCCFLSSPPKLVVIPAPPPMASLPPLPPPTFLSICFRNAITSFCKVFHSLCRFWYTTISFFIDATWEMASRQRDARFIFSIVRRETTFVSSR